MCNSAAFIVTEHRVLWSRKGDRHTNILKENEIPDISNSPDFVRCEIVPPYYNYSLPIDQWQFRRDQDLLPPWATDHDLEFACRQELSNWYAVHVITDGEWVCKRGETRIFLGHAICMLQSGGVSRQYNKAILKSQIGGESCQYNDAVLESQSGGISNQYGNAILKSQSGGESNQHGCAVLESQSGGKSWKFSHPVPVLLL